MGSALTAGVLASSLSAPIMGLLEVHAQEQKVGSLTIVKYEKPPVGNQSDFSGGKQTTPNVPDMEGMPEQEGEPKVVEGVTFSIKQVESFDEASGEWTDVTNGHTAEGTTNAQGVISFDNLPLGRYEVQETDAPAHIIANKDTFYVDLPMTYNNGNDYDYNVTIYPKNETVLGNIGLTKNYHNVETGENLPLQGVTFGLYNKDNDEEVAELTTGEDGRIEFDGLPQGSYYLREKSTVEGINLDDQEIYFIVEKTGDGDNQSTRVVWEYIEEFTSEADAEELEGMTDRFNIDALNYEKPVLEKFVKRIGGEALKEEEKTEREEWFEFHLHSSAKDLHLYDEFTIYDELDDKFEFDANGDSGEDWVVETGDGVLLNDNIDFNYDEATNRVSWTLRGDQVKDFANITFYARIKRDVVETSPIPNQFHMDYDNGRGEIVKGQPSNRVTVTPLDGGVQIIKLDTTTEERLENAVFKLTTDKEGTEVVDASASSIRVNGEEVDSLENLTTNGEGEIEITGLTPDTYYLHETKAPTFIRDEEEVSYRRLTRPITVEIEDTFHVDLPVKNSKSLFSLPATGGIGMAMVLGVSGALGFVGYKKSKKDEEENDAQ